MKKERKILIEKDIFLSLTCKACEGFYMTNDTDQDIPAEFRKQHKKCRGKA